MKELVDDYVALVVLNDTGAKLKLDQEHLETVIPQVSLPFVGVAPDTELAGYPTNFFAGYPAE